MTVSFLFLNAAAMAADICPQYSAGASAGNLGSSLINEASGIAASRKNADVLWIHNDSGDSARVFAVDRKGALLGIYDLSGVSARDWEDIAIGPGPIEGQDYLYIGDIGDNSGVYPYVTVYRAAEPSVDSDQTPATFTLSGTDSITLQYPDGPRDAETLMLDPVTRDIYIISKRTSYSRVYRAAYPHSTSAITTLEYKCQLPWGWAVGGDIAPAGNIVIVRGYYNASVWYRGQGTNLWDVFAGRQCSVPLKIETQGEAVCFDADGCGYFTISEGLSQPLYYFSRQGRCNMTGDIIRNGVIDFSDFAAFAGGWPLETETADLNKDGIADFGDLSVLADTWLETEVWP